MQTVYHNARANYANVPDPRAFIQKKSNQLTVLQQATLPYAENTSDCYIEAKEKAMCFVLTHGNTNEKIEVIFSVINQKKNQKLPDTIRERCSFILQFLGIQRADIIADDIADTKKNNLFFLFDYAIFVSNIQKNCNHIQKIRNLNKVDRAFVQVDLNYCFEIIQAIAFALYDLMHDGTTQIKTHAALRLIELSQNKLLSNETRDYLKEIISELNVKNKFVGLKLDEINLGKLDLTHVNLNSAPDQSNYRQNYAISTLSLIEKAHLLYYKDAPEEYLSTKEAAMVTVLNSGTPEQKREIINSLIATWQNPSVPYSVSERCSIILQLLKIKIGEVITETINVNSIPPFTYDSLINHINQCTTALKKIRGWSPLKSAFTRLDFKCCFEVTQHIVINLCILLANTDAAADIEIDKAPGSDPQDLADSIYDYLENNSKTTEPSKNTLVTPQERAKAFYHLIQSSENPRVSKEVREYLKRAITALNERSKFTGLNLTGFDLTKINLSELNLSYSSFMNANLSQANLNYTNLTGCNLNGVNLNDASMCETCLNAAFW